jgi:thioredoxin reductase
MSEIKIYGKPWCSETEELKKLLKIHNIDFDLILFETSEGLPRELLDSPEVAIREMLPSTPILQHAGKFYYAPGRAVLGRLFNIDFQRVKDYFDIIVIGGGLTGLIAARQASVKGLTCGLLERSDLGGSVKNTSKFYNVSLNPDIIPVSKLLEDLQNWLLDLQADIILASRVESIASKGSIFEVKTLHRKYTCLSVILATGMNREKLSIVNFDRFHGRNLFYNPPFIFEKMKGDKVAVFAGNKRGLYFTYLVSRIASETTVLFPGVAPEKEPVFDDLAANANVKYYENCRDLELDGLTSLQSITFNSAGKREEAANTLFVFDKFLKPDKMIGGIKGYSADGTIDTNDNLSLKMMPGIFSSGDCRSCNPYLHADYVTDAFLAAESAYRYIKSV